MNTKSDDTVFENRMPVKYKSIIVMDKWTIIGAIVGGIWGLISLVLWILTSGGSTIYKKTDNSSLNRSRMKGNHTSLP